MRVQYHFVDIPATFFRGKETENKWALRLMTTPSLTFVLDCAEPFDVKTATLTVSFDVDEPALEHAPGPPDGTTSH